MAFLWGSFLGGDGKGGGLAPTVAVNLRTRKQQLDNMLVDGAKTAAEDSRQISVSRNKDEKAYLEKVNMLRQYGLDDGQIKAILKGGLARADEYINQIKNHRFVVKSHWQNSNPNANPLDFDYKIGFGGENLKTFNDRNFKAKELHKPQSSIDIMASAKNYAINQNPLLGGQDATLRGVTSVFGKGGVDEYAKSMWDQSYSSLGGLELSSELQEQPSLYDFSMPLGDITAETELQKQQAIIQDTKLSSQLKDQLFNRNIYEIGRQVIVDKQNNRLFWQKYRINGQTITANEISNTQNKIKSKFLTEDYWKEKTAADLQASINNANIDPNTAIGALMVEKAELEQKYTIITDGGETFVDWQQEGGAKAYENYKNISQTLDLLQAEQFKYLAGKTDAQISDGAFTNTFLPSFKNNLTFRLQNDPLLSDKFNYVQNASGGYDVVGFKGLSGLSTVEMTNLRLQLATAVYDVYGNLQVTLSGLEDEGLRGAEAALAMGASQANNLLMQLDNQLIDQTEEGSKPINVNEYLIDTRRFITTTNGNTVKNPTYLKIVNELPSAATSMTVTGDSNNEQTNNTTDIKIGSQTTMGTDGAPETINNMWEVVKKQSPNNSSGMLWSTLSSLDTSDKFKKNALRKVTEVTYPNQNLAIVSGLNAIDLTHGNLKQAINAMGGANTQGNSQLFRNSDEFTNLINEMNNYKIGTGNTINLLADNDKLKNDDVFDDYYDESYFALQEIRLDFLKQLAELQKQHMNKP